MRKAMVMGFVFGCFASLSIDSAVPAMTASARVSVAASPAEQIARASALWQQMEHAPAAQRPDLFARAWANLVLVRKSWPSDATAAVRSGLMQADLAGEFGLWRNAIGPLTEILPAAASQNSVAQVERRLGQAYELTGNSALAEQHLLAAEAAVRTKDVNRVESEAVLSGLANFYARHDRPADAIQRFHAARDLAGQDAVNKVVMQTFAAQQALKVDAPTVSGELARLDELIAAARRTTLSARDATVVNHAEQQAQRIRAAAHL